MPATSPAMGERQREHLRRLGARLKDERKAQKVSATVCAEAAGISRVTLHRIETGNPSVTMGSYLNVITALGLSLVVPLPDRRSDGAVPTVKVIDYPGLRRLAWQLHGDTAITEIEALNIYEREWRHLDQSVLDDREKLFIQHLADTYSHGALLV